MTMRAVKGLVSLGVVAAVAVSLSAEAQPRRAPVKAASKAVVAKVAPATTSPSARLPHGRACDNNGNGCLGAHESCQQGVCQCDPGAVRCGATVAGVAPESCTMVAADEGNCGVCGKACAPGLVCESGACKACPAGQALCNGACVNLLADRDNCGQCGRACSNSVACQAGSCHN